MGRWAARLRARRAGAPESWPAPGPSPTTPPPAPGPPARASVRAAAPRGRPLGMAAPPSAPVPRSPFYLRRPAPGPQCSWGMEERAAAGAGCREPPGPLRAAAVPCFGICVHQDDILPGALRLIQELRPHWKPEQVQTKVAERASGNVCPRILPGLGPRGRGCCVGGLGWGVVCLFPSPSASGALHIHPSSPACGLGPRRSTCPLSACCASGPTPCGGTLLPLAAQRRVPSRL